MKSRSILGMAAALLFAPAVPAVQPGDPAPAWSEMDFEGREIRFPAVTGGSPAVLVFWATWCNYCKAFMPYLENIAADYGDYGVRVITINAKEDYEEDPAEYLAALGFPMVAVRNGDAIARAYDVEYIPGLMVVDGDGQVVYRRPWTELKAGRTVAELWLNQVRTALDSLVGPEQQDTS